jgi:hypothetical protein
MAMYTAASVSKTILPAVRQPHFQAHLLASFPSACNLLLESGHIITIVTPAVGNGPLNVVVDGALALPLCQPGLPVRGDGCILDFNGAWQVDLTQAAVWDPLPDYETLRQYRATDVRQSLLHLQTLLDIQVHRDIRETSGLTSSGNNSPSRFQQRIQQPISALLAAYANGDLDGIQRHATALAGLGPGLTPAGDDWLAGWLVGLRWREAILPHHQKVPVNTVATVVLSAAKGRTHPLSLAFLHAAAAGEVHERWHELLSNLLSGETAALAASAAIILSWGATSGADMLAGFLAAWPIDTPQKGDRL